MSFKQTVDTIDNLSNMLEEFADKFKKELERIEHDEVQKDIICGWELVEAASVKLSDSLAEIRFNYLITAWSEASLKHPKETFDFLKKHLEPDE